MLCGDEDVMRTNDDATNCKRYAVKLGYWEDPFIEAFHTSHNKFDKHAPEINRGYFARVFAIKYLMDKFFEQLKSNNLSSTKCQIVNIGSGFDTLYWRLKEIYKVDCIASFIDVDLPEMTMKKLHHIRLSPTLLKHLDDDIKFSSTELHSNVYHLIGTDLRCTKELNKKLFNDCGLDKSLPTLFIAECVLIYMTVDETNTILSWLPKSFQNSLFINYEQVNIFDKFGEIMIENLRQRRCELLDLDSCKDLESQCLRFKNNGFKYANAWDMNFIYKSGLPCDQIERIEKLEFLDESNLLEQLLKHYCIVVAANGLSEDSFNEISF